ncbi:MAG: iron-sulfur cluster assembly scaffold protein [Pirellulales bacterium]
MNHYSPTIIDHFESPRNAGRMERPDAIGMSSIGGRAPYMTMYLRLENDLVAAMFQTFGCGASIAAGSVLTEMVSRRPVSDCLAIKPDEVERALGGLPEEKRFCADLAVDALRDALRQLVNGNDQHGSG